MGSKSRTMAHKNCIGNEKSQRRRMSKLHQYSKTKVGGKESTPLKKDGYVAE